MVTVLVLMSTYNGEAYLTEQVESILKQADVNVKLLVREMVQQITRLDLK